MNRSGQDRPLRDTVTLRTERFDTRERPHHINPCCRSEDFALWLHTQLVAGLGSPLHGPYQEDFGWVIDIPRAPSRDVVTVTLTSFDADAETPHPLLCAAIDGRRGRGTLASWFRRGRSTERLAMKETIIRTIDRILQAEDDLHGVAWWHGGPLCGAPGAHPDS